MGWQISPLLTIAFKNNNKKNIFLFKLLPHTPDESHFSLSFTHFTTAMYLPLQTYEKNHLISLPLHYSAAPFLHIVSLPLFFYFPRNNSICCCCNLKKQGVKNNTVTGQSFPHIIFTVSHFQVLQCPSLILSLSFSQLISLISFNCFTLTVPLPTRCLYLFSLLCFSSSLSFVLFLSPFSDWFISQITYGHHKQPQALLSISYSLLPSPFFSLLLSPSFSTVCHCHLSVFFTAHALWTCVPLYPSTSQSLLVPYVFNEAPEGVGGGDGWGRCIRCRECSSSL